MDTQSATPEQRADLRRAAFHCRSTLQSMDAGQVVMLGLLVVLSPIFAPLWLAGIGARWGLLRLCARLERVS